MSNFNEKPAQLFIGKTIEKPGSDTLINFSASEPVFCSICNARFQEISMTNLLS